MANLLLYGPPGTGKTTTVMNLIDEYQRTVEGGIHSDLVIHLNASDERGIEIIRGPIISFVTSKPLFRGGVKFVVLDEVDYMTKNAQQALKTLILQSSTAGDPVRFCLICNYITKIDPALRNECVALPFHQLPPDLVLDFLQQISDQEGLGLRRELLQRIQRLFYSDMRSMINFIQSNLLKGNDMHILGDTVWEHELAPLFQTTTETSTEETETSTEDIIKSITHISIQYNIDKKTVMKEFLNWKVQQLIQYPSSSTYHDFYVFVERFMHAGPLPPDIALTFAINALRTY
jgi:replication factor C subunit 3/5